MIKKDNQLMSIDDIIAKIKDDVNKRDIRLHTEIEDVFSIENGIKASLETTLLYKIAVKIGKFLQKNGFSGFVNIVKRKIKLNKFNNIYQLSDFVKLYDEAFIENAFILILKRLPDSSGKEYYLSQLRSGKLSKVEIIVALHFSAEGKKQNVIIKGIKKRYIQSIMYRLPFIGYIIKTFYTLLTIPKLLNRLNSFENFTVMQDTIMNELLKKSNNDMLEEILFLKSRVEELEVRAESLEKELEVRVESLKKELNEKLLKIEDKLGKKVNKNDFELYLKIVSYAKDYITAIKSTIDNFSDEINKKILNDNLNSDDLEKLKLLKNINNDDFYVKFEDEFRGSREEIKNKLNIYIPVIEKLYENKQDINILDVGCGRGEWLELLKENNFVNLKGIDLNTIMVKISKNLQLDVDNIDVISYLKSLENNSVSVITGFHIIEHLSFEDFDTLLQESYRVIKQGGLLLLETPNPRNILVGASDFYLDPTHNRPIHPATLKFLLSYKGFNDVKSFISSKNELINFDELKFETINDYIYIGRDLCVIGYK